MNAFFMILKLLSNVNRNRLDLNFKFEVVEYFEKSLIFIITLQASLWKNLEKHYLYTS